MDNTFAHIEIPVKDVKKAKEFYEAIFSWEITIDTDFPGYAFFKTAEGKVGGAFDQSDEKKASGDIMLYVEVEDIPVSLEKIKKAGGKVTQEKTAIGGEMGFFATFEDVFGNVLGLWSSK
ncbi:MAG: VOC family protein [Asgard group archaeon]|nr:VOC family protein [Asgard group archaeon]